MSDKNEQTNYETSFEELQKVNSLIDKICRVRETNHLMTVIINEMIQYTDADQGVINLITQNKNDDLVTIIREKHKDREIDNYKVDDQIAGWVLKNNQLLKIDDLDSDERFTKITSENGIYKSMICSPLFAHGDIIGLTTLIRNNKKKPFEDDHARLVGIISSQAAQILKSALILEELAEELKEKQIQLVQSEKMAALGNLVAGVAHEINTPMGALKSNNDLFVRITKKIKESFTDEYQMKDTVDSETVTRYFDNIVELTYVNRTASDRIIKIVNSLRNFARLDQCEKDKIDLHEGIESTLTLIHHSIKNKIEIKRDYKLQSLVNCYANQINQVFMNILVNASQAISGKGTIIIKTSQVGNEAIVKFSDSGLGISQENIKRIFDPGFTTKGVGVGTGLGLSIVHQIIKNHNGRIDIESKENLGTNIIIFLPLE